MTSGSHRASMAAMTGATGHDRSLRQLQARPSLQIAVVACMDARLDVHASLGFSQGQAHVIRNAGGVVTDDVMRSLAISQHRLGTRTIVLVHHTDCGMTTLTDEGFRSELRDAAGQTPSFAIESFDDVFEDVLQSMRRLESSPFLKYRDDIHGYVYDVATGALTRVLPLDAA